MTFRKQVFALLGERYSDKTLVLCPTVFVKLLSGDHKAAILLSQILYWSDKTKDKDGWFYKSYTDWQLETGLSETQIRRIVNGDPRVKTPQLTLRDLGVETLLRKVRHTGAPTLHYRINQSQFIAALHAFLDPEHCALSTPDNAGDELLATPTINADQSAGTLIPQETPTQEESAEDQQSTQPDEDFAMFNAYEHRFGKRKSKNAPALRAEWERLGTERVGQVLERCASRGRSWNYVLQALANEATPEVSPQSLIDERYGGFLAFSHETALSTPEAHCEAYTPVSARLSEPLDATGKTPALVWAAAYHQLEMQLDRSSFAAGLSGTRLMDYDPEMNCLIVVAPTVYACDLLTQRLARTIQRVLNDVAGQPVGIEVVLADERVGQIA